MTTAFKGIHFFSSDEIKERVEELQYAQEAHNEAVQGDLFTLAYSDADRAEHETLCAFIAQCEGRVTDWEYAAHFIHEDAFYDYIVEQTQELYPDVCNPAATYPHRFVTIDWDALVEANRSDYTVVTLDGETYYVQS